VSLTRNPDDCPGFSRASPVGAQEDINRADRAKLRQLSTLALKHRLDVIPNAAIKVALLLVSTGAIICLVCNREWGWIASWLRARFPGKGLWDYLDVFAIPFTSGLFILYLARTLEESARKRERRHAQGRERAREEEARSKELQAYFDRVSSILFADNIQCFFLDKGSGFKGHNAPAAAYIARNVIRARTLAILRFFSSDAEKKSSVVLFLSETRALERIEVSLAGCDLRQAVLPNIDLENANLQEAELNGAILRSARLGGANLKKAWLVDADLVCAWFNDMETVTAYLQNGLCLHEQDVNGASLGGAILEGADMRWTYLLRVNLNSARLGGADLRSAHVYDCDLGGSDLSGVDFVGAQLKKTTFSGSRLELTDFSGAELSEASFTGTDLSRATFCNASLQDVIWDNETIWPSPQSLAGARNMPLRLRRQLEI